MTIEHSRSYLTPELNRIKREVLNEDPDDPIHIHLSDINGRKGPFGVLNDMEVLADFRLQMGTLIRNAEYCVITAFIDKQWMVKQTHWTRTHPYHYMAEMLFERYALFLHSRRTTGDIMPEGRDDPLNSALQREFDRIRENGLAHMNADNFRRRVPVASLKFRRKKDNVAGLQLCDLLAYPSHQMIRQRLDASYKPNRVCLAIGRVLEQSKYLRSADGRIEGYGVKCQP